jgi:hypothetical protein
MTTSSTIVAAGLASEEVLAHLLGTSTRAQDELAQMSDWNRDEVEAVVADYLAMLRKELMAEPYVKAEHNRQLREGSVARSKGSVEFKYQNISAVLANFGQPYIAGYKPRNNYQQLLEQVVLEHLEEDPDYFLRLWDSPLLSPKKAGDTPLLLDLVVEPPPEPARRVNDHERAARIAAIDFVARDAANRALGQLGEEWVLEFEQRRLHDRDGRPDLAKRVEWSSRIRGDGLGYDITSFDASGDSRLIEVKTTGLGKAFPFFVSPNELRVSQKEAPRYHLYRVFEFGTRPRMFMLQGSLNAHCELAPSQYRAQIK